MAAGSVEDFAIADRRARVAELRRKGWSLRKIGAELGVCHVTVFRDIDANLELLNSSNLTDTAEYRAFQLAKLDDVQEELWATHERSVGKIVKTTIKDGVTKETTTVEEFQAGDVGALNGVRSCIEVEAKLTGTPAPLETKNTHSFENKTTAELRDDLAKAGVTVDDPASIFDDTEGGDAAPADDSGDGDCTTDG